MDSERSRAPRRRRPPWVVVAVGAAVVLAGGSGVYWATTSSEGGAARPASRKDDPPQPLHLTGGLSPAGGKLIVKGKLPDGPGSAAVRLPGTVSRAAVERLAQALGIPGAVKSDQGLWKAGGPAGPTLQVNQRAPGNWAYSLLGSAPPSPGNSGTGTVPARTAKEKAAPVLAALGLGSGQSDASTIAGNTRPVTVDPVVGGLPTHGWRTALAIGPDGRIVSGHGMLSPLTEGGIYPVVSAAQAVQEANGGGTDAHRPGCASAPTGSNIPGVPGGDPTLPRVLPCLAGPETVPVLSARFGLSAQFVDGTPALVPSWLFQVARERTPAPDTVAQQAVEPRCLAASATPVPATPTSSPSGSGPSVGIREMEIQSYSTGGTSLTVRFWGGVCSDYFTSADESGTRVLVRVVAVVKRPGHACVMLARELTGTVRLAKPLSDREVIDASDGSTVPRT